MVIVVHFPIRPGLRTTMLSRVPARRWRSNVRSRPAAAARAKRRTGQELPRQRTETDDPRGARTESRVIWAPDAVSRPAMRTTGNGFMIRRPAAPGGSAVNTGFDGWLNGVEPSGAI